jgi:hypothetical protein
MLDELLDVPVFVLLGILDRLANLRVGEACQIIGVFAGGKPQFGAPGGRCAPTRLWF